MSDADAPTRSGPSVDAGNSRDGSLSTVSVLAGALSRLGANPAALVALLLAGGAVAGIDWVRLHDPVPTVGYEGIQQGRVAVEFDVMVNVASRATTPASALLHLEPAWLAATVGLALVELAVVVAASSYALGRLLDVQPSPTAVARYGLAVALFRYSLLRATFDGGAVVVGLLLVAALFVVAVRLVLLPVGLLLGDSFGGAVRRSWRATRGHGWALLGVALVIGVANHLLVSVALVGPVGSGAVAAVHAGALAAVVSRLDAGGTGPR